MTKKIIKLDNETSIEMQQATDIKSMGSNIDSNEQIIDVSDQSIDALKYALHSLIHNQGSVEGTSNLNSGKIKALSRMKILNHFYKCDAVDAYYENILHLRQSMTDHPNSILEIMGNLFRFQPNQNQAGSLSKMTSFLRGRQ